MKISRLIASFALIIGGCLFAQSHAGAVTINGLGFTTAQDTNPAPSNDGTHFHSDSGGSFGNPAGLLEVGTYFVNPLHIEEIRGHGEFNLASIPAGAATLSFDVFGLGGLFSQANFVGDIEILMYEANDAEDLTDYSVATVGSLATFNTGGLAVGDTLNFNVTTAVNDAKGNGYVSLGFRFQALNLGLSTSNVTVGGVTTHIISPLSGAAITFEKMRILVEDGPIPEPEAWLLVLIWLAGLGYIRLRRGRSNA